MDAVVTISAIVGNQQDATHETTSIHSGNTVTIPDQMYQKATRAVLWKLDKRLIPLLTFLELLSFLNRINIGKSITYVNHYSHRKIEITEFSICIIGHAKIAGIEKAIGLTEMKYGWAVSAYFIGFVSRDYLISPVTSSGPC